jgi:hypothetical protein
VPAKLGSFKESSRSPSISSTPSSANTRPTSTSSTSSSGSLDTKRSDTPTKAAAGKPQWLQQLRQQHQQESSSLRQPSTAQGAAQHSLAAQQVESWNQGLAAEDEARNQEAGDSEQHDKSSLLDGAYDETQAASSFQEALLQWRQAGTTGCHNNTSSNSSGGCGPEPRQHHEQSLLHGTYDEAAATGSFQEALKQWRQAGPAAGTGTSTNTSASCAAGSSARSSQAQQCTQQHSSSTSTAANTASGTGPPSRPINSSVAAFLQKLTTRTTNNSNTGPAGSSLVATSQP